MRNMRRKKPEHQLPDIKTGDVVVFARSRAIGREDVNVRVGGIIQRYGVFADGYRQNPLVRGTNLETGETEVFDISLVGGIVERAMHTHAPENCFAWARRQGYLHPVTSKHRGEWVGELEWLAKWALSTLPINLPRQINSSRLHALYQQCGKPGFLSVNYFGWWYRVNSKAFSRWVRRNATAICYAVAEMHIDETESLHQGMAIMEADMGAMMFDEDFRYEAPWDSEEI